MNERVTNEQGKVASLCNTNLCPKECPYYKYDNCPTTPSKKEFALDLLNARSQRDTAWQELREIREAIKADENESTADEVRSLVAERDELLAVLIDAGNDYISQNGSRPSWWTDDIAHLAYEHKKEVTHEMALDAGDPSLEGQRI